jgi:hypothetical protein
LITPTSTPTASVTDPITQAIQNVTNPAQSIANLIATIFVLLLALVLIVRILKLVFTRPSNLVVETFKNSTGNADLDKVLPGLTQHLREKLVQEIDSTREQVYQYKNLGPGELPPESRPIPSDDVDQQLTNLLKSLQDAASGQFKTAVQLLNLVFPPRGTRVTTILHLFGETIGQACMSLEVTDLEGRLEPTPYTVGEPPATQLAAGHQEKGATQQDKSDALLALETRYIELQKPIARWLSIELIRRSWATGQPRTFSQTQRILYQARVWNFVGSLYLASAIDFPEYPFFFTQAIQAYQQAQKEQQAREWHIPYENLGDAYCIWGEQTQQNFEKNKNDVDRQKAMDHYQKALNAYNQALQCLGKTSIGSLAGTKEEQTRSERRIRVELALTYLYQSKLTNTQAHVQQAREEIDRVEKQGDWQPASEINSQTLYDLACFYALQNEKSKAHLYLAYSLARDINRYNEASKDTDLQGIISGLETLGSILSQKLRDEPDLKSRTGKPFEDTLTQVLSDANWSS